MEYTHLGRTGLKVSRLCLGTMNFGPHTTEPDSHAIMDQALELGINFFDTANVYGWKTGEGVTEQIIGRWFAQGGGRREKIVIATKVYGEHGRLAQHARLSALHIKRACEDSLQAPADRLHRPLPDAPRRPRDAVGRDLAGDGAACPGGQGHLRRVAATSPAGTSPRPTRPPRSATSWAWSPSRACTTSTRARSSWRCCPRARATAWA